MTGCKVTRHTIMTRSAGQSYADKGDMIVDLTIIIGDGCSRTNNPSVRDVILPRLYNQVINHTLMSI